MEAFSQEYSVSLPSLACHFKHSKYSPSMDWWIHILKGKLIGRHLKGKEKKKKKYGKLVTIDAIYPKTVIMQQPIHLLNMNLHLQKFFLWL